MIHVSRSGKQEGPYSEEEIRKRLSSGQLSANDFGWHEGMPNWIKLGPLLGIDEPPHVPSAGPSPPPLPDWVTSTARAPGSAGSSRKVLSRLVVPTLGLLGGWCDISLARAILDKVNSFYSDLSSVPWYWQMAIRWLEEEWGEHFMENAATVGHIFYFCGVVGILCAILFFFRRYTKILAGILIVCGLAPMLYEYSRPLTFVGFLMALAGFFGLFVRDKPRSFRINRERTA